MAKTKKPTAKRMPSQPTGQSRLLWIGLGAAFVLFIVIAFILSRQNTIPFELTGGEEKPLIVLRNTKTVFYEFTYTGEAPAKLERLIPRIQVYSDQVLVADVEDVFVRVGEQVYELEEGYFPEGEQLELQPGDVFELGVVYLGQELGWNRIYGFRLQYSAEGVSVDGELELTDNDNYYIFVE